MTIIAEPEQLGFDGPRSEGETTEAPPAIRARGRIAAAVSPRLLRLLPGVESVAAVSGFLRALHFPIAAEQTWLIYHHTALHGRSTTC